MLAADLSVRLLGKLFPQWRIIPGRAADKVVQRVMSGQPKPLRHWLDALAFAGVQQPAHIQRRHSAPRAAAGQVEERREPLVEVVSKVARQGENASRLHACMIGTNA